MDDKWTVEEKQTIINQAMKRAATDPQFRQLVLRDPGTAVQQIAGKNLPAKFNVRVLERQNYDVTIVLPDLVKAGGELSDAELEQVAGGARGPVVICEISCGSLTNVG